MARTTNIYLQNHRHQRLMLLGASALALMVGAAPRNERALFVFGAPETPQAFAAIAPLADPADAPLGNDAPFERSLSPVSGRQNSIPDFSNLPGPAGVEPIGDSFAPVAPSDTPLQLASFTPASGGPLAGGPLAGSSQPSFGPAGQASSSALAPAPAAGTSPIGPAGSSTPPSGQAGAPGGTTVPVPGATSGTLPDQGTASGTNASSSGPVGSQAAGAAHSPPPVDPLPEPKAWLLMIFGFLGVGAVFRRQRRRLNLGEDDALQSSLT